MANHDPAHFSVFLDRAFGGCGYPNQTKTTITKSIFMAQTQTTTTSKQFSLNVRDFFKGLLLAVLTPVVTVLINTLQEGSLTFNWKAIGITAASAFLAYILKNFLAAPEIVITNPTAQQVKEVEAGRKEAVIVPK